jgi:NAD-dependent SIR2 family protein deacetylase
MSLPPWPSASGDKPVELHVYTIEECGNCGQKTKRDFKVGDYIMAEAGTCEKCQGKKAITLIYGEKISQRQGTRRFPERNLLWLPTALSHSLTHLGLFP